jgi:hypothetical protein
MCDSSVYRILSKLKQVHVDPKNIEDDTFHLFFSSAFLLSVRQVEDLHLLASISLVPFLS